MAAVLIRFQMLVPIYIAEKLKIMRSLFYPLRLRLHPVLQKLQLWDVAQVQHSQTLLTMRFLTHGILVMALLYQLYKTRLISTPHPAPTPSP